MCVCVCVCVFLNITMNIKHALQSTYKEKQNGLIKIYFEIKQYCDHIAYR